MVSSSNPQGCSANPFSPSAVSFAGHRSRHKAPLKPLPEQTRADQRFVDLSAMGDALDCESERSSGSMADSFCSTASGGSSRSGSSSRQGGSSVRNVKADDVLQVLSWLGFSDRAQKGSHHQLVSPNLKRSVTIPAHGTRQPIASGTMNSILNQLEEILDEEQSCLPDHEDWEVLANKEALRTWVNDPKGSRHEIQSVGKCLQGEASPLPLRKRHTF